VDRFSGLVRGPQFARHQHVDNLPALQRHTREMSADALTALSVVRFVYLAKG
jgi:hypothetical protein